MTRRFRLVTVAIAVSVTAAAIAVGSAAMAGSSSGISNVSERLSGFEEDLLVVSTTGNGTFKAHINEESQEITWELSYAALEGDVQQAHIHFGGKAQSGGISVFFCTNLGNGPAGTPTCPAAPATITGTFRPADVIGPAGQGIAAGEFDELLAAIRGGVTYVNVHSSRYPGGEIRAQIHHDTN
jgi:CHRD domain